MEEPTRVLLVDDSPFVRRAVERMLEPLSDVDIVGTATDGSEAIEMAQRLRPDVIVLDIVMPEVDGLEAIRQIMETAPTAIVVLSSHAEPGAEVTLRALELGAVDFISKTDAGTRMDIYDLAPQIQEKVVAAAKSRVPVLESAPGAMAPDARPTVAADSRYDLLALGASTGGPRALAAILNGLPAGFPAGIVIAQHMPPGFTRTLAERLDRGAAIRVREAADGDVVEPGLALIGVGGRQLRVAKEGGRLVARIPQDTDRFLHRPSVDVLFESVADAVGDRAVAAVLTGMGEDGARGLARIREAGGRTFVESEETAVIWGMPRVAADSAERALPLDQLAATLRGLFVGEPV